jgi:hypothetical protein
MTGALQKSLRKAGTQLKSSGMQAVRVGAGIATAGASILAPIAASVREFARFGDELDKMSQRTGIAASTLAEFGFAAEQSGTNISDVEKAVKRMQGSIFDLELGLSTAKDGFNSLGLSLDDLKGKRPEDQFQLVANRLADIEDASLRSALAQKVLGRVGPKILPMVENLRELRQESRDLGLIPSEKAVEDAAAVTDAMNRLRRMVKATAFEIGASLAEDILSLAESAKNIIKTVQSWVKNNVDLIRSAIVLGGILAAVGTTIAAVGGGLIAAGFALTGLASVIGFVSAAVSFLLSPLGLFVAA